MPSDQSDARENRLLAALPAAERKQLLDGFEPVELSLKQPLYEPGKPIEHVYFPTSMVASLLAVMDDEQAVEVATIGKEGMLGIPVFLGVTTSPGLAFAQIPGQALRMSAGAFRDRANSAGGLQRLLQRYTYTFFAQLAQGTACNQLHTIEQRLARWLLMTQDRIGRDRFPLTQQFMAQMLGVRRATVTQAAGRLQDLGLITYSRGVITVADRPGLEATSCECYRIITDEYARLFD